MPAGAMVRFQPGQATEFMNPYQQQVLDQALANINRQGDISRQNLQAQAVRAGAFGGSREGVQRAELERGLSETRNTTIANMLNQGYQQAMQQAQQAFEAQQGRQMQGAQLTGQLGQGIGALGAQVQGLGQQDVTFQYGLGQQQQGQQQRNSMRFVRRSCKVPFSRSSIGLPVRYLQGCAFDADGGDYAVCSYAEPLPTNRGSGHRYTGYRRCIEGRRRSLLRKRYERRSP
jgi:hypothetical protein